MVRTEVTARAKLLTLDFRRNAYFGTCSDGWVFSREEPGATYGELTRFPASFPCGFTGSEVVENVRVQRYSDQYEPSRYNSTDLHRT